MPTPYRLTHVQRKELIRTLRTDPKSDQSELAKKYGVVASTISYYKRSRLSRRQRRPGNKTTTVAVPEKFEVSPKAFAAFERRLDDEGKNRAVIRGFLWKLLQQYMSDQ